MLPQLAPWSEKCNAGHGVRSEADAQRYERTPARRDTRADHYERNPDAAALQ